MHDGGLKSEQRASRRRFLGWGAAVVSATAFFSSLPARAGAHHRSLSLVNLHTGERLKAVYCVDGHYIQESLRQFDWLLRDHRTNASSPLDPLVFDLLAELHDLFRSTEAFQVISGYRSPATNRMLAAASNGVARDSLHTRGLAIDVRLPGIRLANLRDAAMSLRTGGVGYYPRSDFVHLDVGRVRYW